jgi:acyl-CoA thioesterase FadM
MKPERLTKAVIDAQSRFISDSKARIGKCVTFGCTHKHQFTELSVVLRTINKHWRKYVAGREGYNTLPDRAGLMGHRIAWGDQDSMGHVNNVMYNRWAETGRVNWARSCGIHMDQANKKAWEDLVTPKGIGLILRSIKTEYKFPLKYPDRITVLHKLANKPEEGMDGLQLDAVIISETHQRVAARITEDCAIYDYRIGKKAPIPTFMVEVLKRLWEEQEKSIEISMNAMSGLSGRIRSVEKETWDRADAVEDMGSATSSGAKKEDVDMLADLGLSVDPELEEPKKGNEVPDETPLEFEAGRKTG